MAEYIIKETLQEKLNRKKAGPANKRYTEGWNDAILMVKSIIHSERATDVELVRHAKWVQLRKGDWTSVYECSLCKRRVTVACDQDKADERLKTFYPYCHCGAKMDS